MAMRDAFELQGTVVTEIKCAFEGKDFPKKKN
jgi:hypothetical protein